MANPRTHPHPPGHPGRLPRRPPRHETLPPQNPPPEIQIRNPYYSNHSNNNPIFSLLKNNLKYLIPQHSRLTGAVRPHFNKSQILPQHQARQPAQADGWAINNLERRVDGNNVPFPPPSTHTYFFRKSSESLIQYYIDSLYYMTYNMLDKTI